MELRDLIVTPLVLMLLYVCAYIIRPRVCDSVNYRYFIPALTVKVLGALAVGFIYQFYYGDGDTFNYHTRGSRVVWETFISDPSGGLALIFLPPAQHDPALYYVAVSKMPFYLDPASYFVIRVASVIDLFTFSSYSATAVVFAALSFIGAWMLFLAFYNAYPFLMNWFAATIFFVPSVFFWGSGLLKDTIVMAALCASVLLVQRVFINQKGRALSNIIALIVCLSIIFAVKKYVLICFAPAVIVWIGISKLLSIRSLILRILVVPVMVIVLAGSSYYAVVKIGEEDKRYSINSLAATAKITAYDIGFYSGRNAGSGYSLGELDGTFTGMLNLAPQAINVSLFRPYLWEVRNPLMFVAALESFVVLVLTLLILFISPMNFLRSFGEPYILFCVAFSLTFAFAVGVSTYNFGTLMRYKIPMLPFYMTALVLIFNYVKRLRTNPAFDATE